MSALSKSMKAIVLMAAIFSPSLAAAAWINTGTEPQIYQTNYWNGPETIASLISSPTAVITTVSFQWGYRYTSHPSNPSYTISAAACWNQNPQICKIGTGSITGGSVTNSPDLAGYAANKNFSIYTNAVSSTTKAFPSSSRPMPNRSFNLVVNYSE